MPNPQAEALAQFAAQGAEWPEQFTDEDKRLMAFVDYLTTEVSKDFAMVAMKHRQQVFSALLATRSALN